LGVTPKCYISYINLNCSWTQLGDLVFARQFYLSHKKQKQYQKRKKTNLEKNAIFNLQDYKDVRVILHILRHFN